jgi:hypothetical protein
MDTLPSAGQVSRLGFLEGRISVPYDFDSMGDREIEELFFGNEEDAEVIVPVRQGCLLGRHED